MASALAAAEAEDLDAAVDEVMKDFSAAQLSASSDNQDVRDDFTEGAIVMGRIANIGSEDVLIDFGAKALGSMPLSDIQKEETCSVGDEIEVFVVGEDKRTGLVTVSRKKARHAALMRDMKVGVEVEGSITGMNKGGLDMDIDGIRAFIPASQVDIHFLKDISELIGQTVRAEVTKFDREAGDVVVSRRKYLIREQAARKKDLFAQLEVGQIKHGRVRSLTDYGAFVDIGGIDGLLHISDMSWGRIAKPDDLLKVGDEIDVRVLKLSAEDKKISLGLKQVTESPWQNVEEKYTVGSTLKARVVRLANFGAFVELEPGIDGLLPISEMSWTRRIRHPSELVKEGDVIEVGVASVDGTKKRISLSLKQLGEDPWADAETKYTVDSKVNGKVVRTTEFGAFVELEDGIDGLLHISELANERVKAVTDKVKPGQEIEVRVLGVDKDAKRISLSMRPPPAEPSPEELAKIQKAAARKKSPGKPRRGGLTLDWEIQGLDQIDPSSFA
ncbi:MAG: S1 RNA-binding domain-containing protein [Planctomycetota bacterium]|nr:S1 RNA-binding domain-containing protein [Planctomycetota bacterium]